MPESNTTIPKKVDWSTLDLELDREGEKIILPDKPGPMSIDDGIVTLQRIKKAENTVYEVSEPINAHFFDGLVALTKAIKIKYGFSQASEGTVQTFFGKMKVPPQLIHVRTGPGPDDYLSVPFGTINFPNVEGSLETKFGESRGIPVLRLVGSVKAKEKGIVMEIVKLANQIAKEQSIYRGQSIILERDEKDNGVNLHEPLPFFDPNAGREVPIFNAETEDLIKVALLSPLERTETCRSMGIPLKRGALLEGPYGTGKTLLARQVARVANANGWTFILVTAASALKYGLDFAKMYQPAVVFAEDIDRIAENRNEGANDLINQIDGVVGKNDEIITVLTTNFADRIDRAFLRPGRLDVVISLRPPEKEAVERLIRFYGGNLIDAKEKLDETCDALAGQIPASIREVVERAKLSMLTDGREVITAHDLRISAVGMQNHIDLINKASEGNSPQPDFDEIVRRNVVKALEDQGF